MGVLAVFNAEGDQWKKYRKPTAEALNLRKVKSFYPTLTNKTGQLLAICQRKQESGGNIDIRSLLRRFTTDVTTALAVGYALDTLSGKEDKLQQCMEMVFPMVNQRMSAPLAWWRWWKRAQDRKFDDSLAFVRKTILEFIQKAEGQLADDPDLQKKPANFLQALLSEEKELSREEIYSAVFTLLMAGEDTTANSLAWVMYYLAIRPDVVQRLREEAREVYPDSEIPEDAVQHQHLQYAYAVAQEAIRLKPTSPQLILQAQEDVVINDLKIPAGTNVILQNRAAQISEEYFYRPQEFLPERWLAKGCPIHAAHQPDIVRAFGGGPRYCPGKHLALHEMVIVTSVLARHFDLELLGDANAVQEAYSFTMHPSLFEIKLTSAR